jgi:hypothetical protein
VKTRRVIFHALLSLLLLMSQQIGFAHRISHGFDSGAVKLQKQSGVQGASQQSSRQATSLLKQSSVSLLADQLCEQCLFFAQIGSALTTDVLSLSFGSADNDTLVIGATPLIHLRAIRAFQSRAPPSSV